MPDYPPGYDPSQADYITAEDQAIGALIGLAAFGAVSIGVFVLVGELGGVATTSGVSSVFGTTSFDVETMIAEEMLASGGSASEVEAFINACALARNVAVLEAATEAAAVTATAIQNAGTITAAIILASARVQEQAALHEFFGSGIHH